jgi:hypothetical protein
VFVDDGVLVRVLVNSEVASRGSEEVGEEVDFNGEGEWLGDGRRDGGDWGDDDGRGKVLNRDVLERDVLEGVVV